MPVPRFSIVIPTRNRARTLAFALRTCLLQEFEDFEVVVSDNDSPPATREVAESFGDRRIKYVRTPTALAMTDSLEFAVSHATGEFITLIGDDDGYLPHSLREMDRILRLVDARALRWDAVVYNWPDIAPQRYARPNALLLPLRLLACNYHFIQSHESRPRIGAAAQYKIGYADLPMIFCSVIHREIFEKLRRQTGRYFKSRTPDVYAAFAVAHAAGTYHSLNAPLAIVGTSGQSTGIARHFVKGQSAIDTDFRTLNDQAGHALHAHVPDLPPIPSAVADAFLYFKEALSPDDAGLTLDRQQMIARCLEEIEVESEEEWRRVLDICQTTLTDDAQLRAWFDSTYASQPFASGSRQERKQATKHYGGDYLCLDASEFGVSDVVGVAELCEKLFGYKRDGMDARPHTPGPAMSAILDQLQAILKEREQIILELDALRIKRLAYIDELMERIGVLERELAAWPSVRRVVRRALRRFLPERKPPEAA
jgi:hypothetical protein